VPDLTIETGFCCESNEHWQTKVLSSKGVDEYTVVYGRDYTPGRPWDFDWSCSCPAFQHRHKARGEHCKHIKAVQSQRCGWNAELEPFVEPDHDEQGEPRCPQCKGPVVAFRTAV
jgi:hypothetical protein